MNIQHKAVGQSIYRKDGWEKATGSSLFIDDMHFPDMIYGATIRSSVPRGKIKSISFIGDIPWEEFTIVTAKDIPGKNTVKGFTNDQPFLANEFINHVQEPVALIAHKDKYLLQNARKSVIVDVESCPAVFTIKDSFEKKHIIWGTDNILKNYEINKGNIDDV
jgi:CO/xanthine dehydrogenase Mo-binding subunit